MEFVKDHNKLGVIINGDALYASIPVIKKIHEHNANYIFKHTTGQISQQCSLYTAIAG